VAIGSLTFVTPYYHSQNHQNPLETLCIRNGLKHPIMHPTLVAARMPRSGSGNAQSNLELWMFQFALVAAFIRRGHLARAPIVQEL
jgi:hypothetical protein